jgi:hypothetical protein
MHTVCHVGRITGIYVTPPRVHPIVELCLTPSDIRWRAPKKSSFSHLVMCLTEFLGTHISRDHQLTWSVRAARIKATGEYNYEQ